MARHVSPDSRGFSAAIFYARRPRSGTTTQILSHELCLVPILCDFASPCEDLPISTVPDAMILVLTKCIEFQFLEVAVVEAKVQVIEA